MMTMARWFSLSSLVTSLLAFTLTKKFVDACSFIQFCKAYLCMYVCFFNLLLSLYLFFSWTLLFSCCFFSKASWFLWSMQMMMMMMPCNLRSNSKRHPFHFINMYLPFFSFIFSCFHSDMTSIIGLTHGAHDKRGNVNQVLYAAACTFSSFQNETTQKKSYTFYSGKITSSSL